MDIPHPSKLVSDCTPCFQIAVAPKFIALLRRFNQLIVERRQLHLPLHAHCANRATTSTAHCASLTTTTTAATCSVRAKSSHASRVTVTIVTAAARHTASTCSVKEIYNIHNKILSILTHR